LGRWPVIYFLTFADFGSAFGTTGIKSGFDQPWIIGITLHFVYRCPADLFWLALQLILSREPLSRPDSCQGRMS